MLCPILCRFIASNNGVLCRLPPVDALVIVHSISSVRGMTMLSAKMATSNSALRLALLAVLQYA